MEITKVSNSNRSVEHIDTLQKKSYDIVIKQIEHDIEKGIDPYTVLEKLILLDKISKDCIESKIINDFLEKFIYNKFGLKQPETWYIVNIEVGILPREEYIWHGDPLSVDIIAYVRKTSKDYKTIIDENLSRLQENISNQTLQNFVCVPDSHMITLIKENQNKPYDRDEELRWETLIKENQNIPYNEWGGEFCFVCKDCCNCYYDCLNLGISIKEVVRNNNCNCIDIIPLGNKWKWPSY